MHAAKRILTLALILAGLSSVASGYYNWIFFANRTGPFRPIPAKFALNGLSNNAIPYFISASGPGPLMPGDSFDAIVSEIRLAAEAWNGVATSALRLQFGGIASVGGPQGAPGIDVVFDDDMPPGLLARTGITTPDDLSGVANGVSYVPILRSRMQLRKDLTVKQQASYSDAFFTTMVHEFGHTLGLQHTLTSGVMSTTITRATTKAKPLNADDVAGVSVLYPAAGFAASTGSIAGRVTQANGGVNLASVVALSTSGAAISALANPDGTYRIDGIPQGQYYLYVHPLPPAIQGEAAAADIVAPSDTQGKPFSANTGFVTQFYPGTRDWTQAAQIDVNAGGVYDNRNFAVQKSNGPAVFNMQTYAYLGADNQVPVQAPSLVSGTRAYLVFYANGTVTGRQPAAGLTVSAIGGAARVEPGTLRYYTDDFLYLIVDANPVSSATPVALSVTVNGDLYVLPAGMSVVPSAPPVVSSVSGSTDAQGNSTVTISGSNLRDNLVVFDGAPAAILQTTSDGSLVVEAPPASGSHRASVEVLARDGQTSSQALGSAVPPAFIYSLPGSPRISVNPPSIAAGTDAMVEINGSNTFFVEGQSVTGFGSSDVTVRRAWFLNRGRILLNVSASDAAGAGLSSVTVASGLQLATLDAQFQIQGLNPKRMSLRVPVKNQSTGLAGAPPGGEVLIGSTGLPSNLTGWTLTIGGVKTEFNMGGGNWIYARVPNGIPVGPAVVQLTSPNNDYIPPILMQVDGPPPAIIAAALSYGQTIDAAHPAHPGDDVTLTVSGLADPFATVPASSVHVEVAEVDHAATSVTPLLQPGTWQVRFTLAQNVPYGPQQPVTVGIDTRVSSPFPLAIKLR